MQSFEQFDKDFPNDEACKAYIVLRRWPNGVHCPRCQRKERVYALKTPYRWTCCNADCGGRKGYRFSVTTRHNFSGHQSFVAGLVQDWLPDVDREKGHQFATGAPCDVWRKFWHRLAYRLVYLSSLACSNARRHVPDGRSC